MLRAKEPLLKSKIKLHLSGVVIGKLLVLPM